MECVAGSGAAGLEDEDIVERCGGWRGDIAGGLGRGEGRSNGRADAKAGGKLMPRRRGGGTGEWVVLFAVIDGLL